MAKNYRTEEGHILSNEDLFEMINWLISLGYEHDYIKNYDDSEAWEKIIYSVYKKNRNNDTGNSKFCRASGNKKSGHF